MSGLKIKKIEREMTKRDMSQSALARAVSVTPGHVNHILRGRRTPSVDLLNAICKELSISPRELFA